MTFDNQPGAMPPEPGQNPSFSNNNPGWQNRQNPPSQSGPMSNSNLTWQNQSGQMPNNNSPWQNQQGQMPSSNPGWQNQQGQMPNSNPAWQHQQGQMSNSNPAWQNQQGPVPNSNPAWQNQPGQMSNSNPASQHEQAPVPVALADDKKADVSRRNVLKMSALVGGSLAVGGGVVGGGAVIAGQQLIAHTNSSAAQPGSALQPGSGQLREYWVQADAFHHNLIPSGKDGMMGMVFTPKQSSFWAIGYRAYTPNWGSPLPGSDDIGPNTGIPGPVFRGSVGDTIHVHFRNNDTHYKIPHSMHPHGVLYTPANDGAWIASDPQPGAMIAPGQSYTYEWLVHPNSVGTWVYHDHSVSPIINHTMLMEFGAEVGLFGFLVLTDASTKPATKEFFTFLHDVYQSDVDGLSQDFDCFNGQSYLGNTPLFNAKVGDTIRWHIGALGKEFHAFHLHGHRWISNGQFVDVVQLGPSNALSFDFVADNPGKWLYHCHVTDHMMGGMIGMYIISS